MVQTPLQQRSNSTPYQRTEQPMSPADEAPPSLELVLYELDQLQKRQEEDRRHVDQRLDQLTLDMRSQFRELAYVPKGEYERDRLADARIAAADKQADAASAVETRKIAEDARRVAWATALLLLTVTGVMLTLIKFVAK
jgi:hypothetical protein